MTKLNFYVIVMFCILSKLNNSSGQNFQSSPCPNIFQYGEPGTGYITVSSPQIGETLTLRIELIIQARLPSEYVGALTLATSKEQTLQAIFNGAQSINYLVRFPIPYPLPLITRIYYNDNIICSGQSDGGPGVRTSIKLQHTLMSQRTVGLSQMPGSRPYYQNNGIDFGNNQWGGGGGGANNVYIADTFQDDNQPDTIQFTQPIRPPVGQQQRPNIIYNQRPIMRPSINQDTFQNDNQQDTFQFIQPVIRPTGGQQRPNINNNQQPARPEARPTQPPARPEAPPTQPPATERAPTTSPPELPTNIKDEEICGTIDVRFKANPLIFGGSVIIHGTWPWLAAIYVSDRTSLKYQCGGSLVSSRIVVSAAHCFFTRSGSMVPTNSINVHLGRHNLDIWEEEGEMRRQALLFKVHEDYMSSQTGSFDADIAIVVLKRVVHYNQYVRPICLWAENSAQTQVVGKMGTVVGWGVTEFGDPGTEPKKIDIPIVSESVCLRSADSFTRITSNRTFCAGSRNGTGPCNGDSGSGLALKRNDRWTLRGIVSVSTAVDPIERKCDLSQFLVFTDAAFFVDWIKQYISLPLVR